MSTDDKKRILVVDDESMNIDLLTIYLESDYIITSALNAKQALELAQSDPQPNLILLDVAMPGMDGYEACTQLKANKTTADIPVIFLTALEHELDETTGFDVGAVDYISKPIVPEIVKARIRIHLALEEAQNELRKSQDLVATQDAKIIELNDMLTKMTAQVQGRD